jgi:hypothetical protein
VFGSPVYILHKSLQDNPGSAPKWQSRCWQGVYLGHFPLHASNVALVYNPATHHVTPQFHLTFDDYFSSIQTDTASQEANIDALLSKTAWLYQDEFAATADHHHFISQPESAPAPAALLSTPSRAPSGTPGESTLDMTRNRAKYRPISASEAFIAWKEAQGISAEVFTPVSAPPHTTTIEGVYPPEGAYQGSTSRECYTESTPTSVILPLTGIVHTAAPSPGDTLTQSGMLKAVDSADFIKAQVLEIENLNQSGVFSYHHIHTLPPKAKLLNAIWSYRRKCSPSGEFRKHKARICTDGSKQQYGIDYWETYAPVVSWSSVRLLLTMAHIHKWKSCQIDFTQAFTQPPIKEDVYMKIPQGWSVVDGSLIQHADPKHRDVMHYIKLEKSLYGIKQAARTYHLEPGLIKLGFKASAVDPCLFYRADCIICLYVDDCLLFSPTSDVITSVLSALRRDYLIGEEGSVQDFLGVNITSTQEGHIQFQQPALIASILADLHLEPCHPKPTPAFSVLHPDHGGFVRTENWNY